MCDRARVHGISGTKEQERKERHGGKTKPKDKRERKGKGGGEENQIHGGLVISSFPFRYPTFLHFLVFLGLPIIKYGGEVRQMTMILLSSPTLLWKLICVRTAFEKCISYKRNYDVWSAGEPSTWDQIRVATLGSCLLDPHPPPPYPSLPAPPPLGSYLP